MEGGSPYLSCSPSRQAVCAQGPDMGIFGGYFSPFTAIKVSLRKREKRSERKDMCLRRVSNLQYFLVIVYSLVYLAVLAATPDPIAQFSLSVSHN